MKTVSQTRICDEPEAFVRICLARFGSYLGLKEIEQKEYAVCDFCERGKSWNPWDAGKVEKCKSVGYGDKQQCCNCAEPSTRFSLPKPEGEE